MPWARLGRRIRGVRRRLMGLLDVVEGEGKGEKGMGGKGKERGGELTR